MAQTVTQQTATLTLHRERERVVRCADNTGTEAHTQSDRRREGGAQLYSSRTAPRCSSCPSLSALSGYDQCAFCATRRNLSLKNRLVVMVSVWLSSLSVSAS